MNGFGLLLRKEIQEQTRTMRLLVVAIVLALFGITSPPLAKYLPEILRAVAPGQVPPGLIPTPTTADSVAQILKNVGQFGAIAAILLAMGSVATEKERGTAALVLTKPVSRAGFLVAKLVAISLNLLLGTVVACALGYVYTAMLFETLPPAGFVAMTLVLWLSLVVYAALTFLGSTLARSAMAGAGLGLVFMLVTGIVSALPNVGRWMPEGLAAPASALALGRDPGDLWGPLAANVALIAGCAVVAWLVFRRQEL